MANAHASLARSTWSHGNFAIGSAGLMRHALAQAIHHSRHRRAFQKPLVDQPLMAAVLADLALESEASTLLAFRLARARSPSTAWTGR